MCACEVMHEKPSVSINVMSYKRRYVTTRSVTAAAT